MERMVGKQAPAFEMQALTADGKEFCSVRLSDYRGKWLVFFFYPMDFTFVCPTELTAFSEVQENLHLLGAETLAVSTDTVYVHQAWVQNGLDVLGYPMASDGSHKVSEAYGVLTEEGTALRGLFIIDPEQTIRYSVIHDDNVGRNPQEILRVLAALQTGGFCAAGWQAGEETLSAETASDTAPVAQPATEQWNGKTVKIYSVPDCSYCRSVKKFLKERGVPYQDINLNEDRAGQKFMADRRYTKLPVTVIGETEISGYDMKSITESLGLKR